MIRIAARFAAVSIAIAIAAPVAAQSSNGNSNGSNNVGSGNGTGNGNGSGNSFSNSTTVLPGLGRGGQSTNTPSVYAPGLAAAGVESCIASASAGGSGAGFGLTFALTTQDKGCNLRLYARTLYAMGHKTAATQVLCNDPEVAQALALEGVVCRTGEAAAYPQAYRAVAVEPEPPRTRCSSFDFFGNCMEGAQPEMGPPSEQLLRDFSGDAEVGDAPQKMPRKKRRVTHSSTAAR